MNHYQSNRSNAFAKSEEPNLLHCNTKVIATFSLTILTFFLHNCEFISHNSDFIFSLKFFSELPVYIPPPPSRISGLVYFLWKFSVNISQFFLWIFTFFIYLFIYLFQILSLHLAILTFFFFPLNSEIISHNAVFFLFSSLNLAFFYFFSRNSELFWIFTFFIVILSLLLVILTFFLYKSS